MKGYVDFVRSQAVFDYYDQDGNLIRTFEARTPVEFCKNCGGWSEVGEHLCSKKEPPSDTIGRMNYKEES